MARTKHVSRKSHLSPQEREALLHNFRTQQEQERDLLIKSLIIKSNNTIKEAIKTIKEEKAKLINYRKEAKRISKYVQTNK
jgi:acyl-CoA reductase-like NAD-dependent aldehyde dehydrogenase